MPDYTPTTPDIAEIARGLTKSQAKLISGKFNSPFCPRSYAQVRAALVRKGLFFPHVGVTPLGLAVHAHLTMSDNAPDNQSDDDAR